MKKKVSPVEVFIIFIVAIGFAFYVIPKMMLSMEQKAYGRIQTNAAMMTSKILAEFSDNTNTKTPTEISYSLSEEMNKLVKNPVDKKNPAYSVNEECEGCILVEPDDNVKNIVLSAKNRENELIVRTVIQPPSFVTYNKDLNKK